MSVAYIHQLETGKTSIPNRQRCRQLALALKTDFRDLWLRACTEKIEKSREENVEGKTEGKLVYLSHSEKVLIDLIRTLDDKSAGKIRGSLRHFFSNHPDDAVRALLKDYLRAFDENS